MNDQQIDREIKAGFAEIMQAIPDSDPTFAIKQLQEIQKQKSRTNKLLLMAASILLSFIIVGTSLSGTSSAFRIFQRNVLEKVSDTIVLYQKQEQPQDDFPEVVYSEETLYHTLEDLTGANIQPIVLPKQTDALFLSARVMENAGIITRITLDFLLDDHRIEVVQIPKYGNFTSTMVIDIEDNTIQQLTVNQREVTVISHKSGTTLLEWGQSNLEFSVTSLTGLDETLEFLVAAGLL